MSELGYHKSKQGEELTPFLSSGIDSYVPGLMETPKTLWCRVDETQSLNFEEHCYSSSVRRTVFLADFFGIVADTNYLSSFNGWSRLNPNSEVLLSYGAGVYGGARVDHPSDAQTN